MTLDLWCLYFMVLLLDCGSKLYRSSSLMQPVTGCGRTGVFALFMHSESQTGRLYHVHRLYLISRSHV